MKNTIKIFISLLVPSAALCFDLLADAQTLPAARFPSSMVIYLLYAIFGPNKVIDGATIPDLGFASEPHFTAMIFLGGVAQWWLLITLAEKIIKKR